MAIAQVHTTVELDYFVELFFVFLTEIAAQEGVLLLYLLDVVFNFNELTQLQTFGVL